MKVTKRIEFCFGHRLPNYTGKCHNIHGHSGVVEISFRFKTSDPATARNEFGMLVDFYDIKQIAKDWIDEQWDHGFIVNYKDTSVLDFLRAQKLKHFVVTADLLNRGSEDPIQYTNPTMENLTMILRNVIEKRIEDFNTVHPSAPPIALAGIRMYESENNWCEV